jgi:hypothetical protein
MSPRASHITVENQREQYISQKRNTKRDSVKWTMNSQSFEKLQVEIGRVGELVSV